MGEISKFYGGMDVSKGRVVALIPANDAGIVSSTQLIVSPQPDYKIYGNLYPNRISGVLIVDYRKNAKKKQTTKRGEYAQVKLKVQI